MRMQISWLTSRSPWCGAGLAVRCWSCCDAVNQMEHVKKSQPVRFVEDDDLVSTRRQCHLLLGKHLDFVANHIDATASLDYR